MRILLALVAGGLLAVLAFTNPDAEAFQDYVQARSEEVLRRETGDGALGRLVSRLGSSVTGALAGNIGERHNYVLFSTYTIDLDGDDRWRFVGIGGHFFEWEAPAALQDDDG